jgi:hypothetical protein
MMLLLMCTAEFTVESKVHHPEHIERVSMAVMHAYHIKGSAMLISMSQNFVFRERSPRMEGYRI